MVLVKTQQGQDLLVDLRNSLIYTRWDRNDDWEPVRLKSKNILVEMGKPIQVDTFLGVLHGLVVVDIMEYTGSHPGGTVRCNCGAIRDEDGECPRCDYGRCQECKTVLKDGLCPADPTHNFQRVPPAPKWASPLEIGEYQSWEKKPEKKKGAK